MPGLDPGIHVFFARLAQTWMAGTSPAMTTEEMSANSLLLRGPGFHVHHLDAAVDRIRRIVRILQLGLAVADGDEIAAGHAVFVDQIALDRVGAAFREVLVESLAADRIGVTGDHEGRT